ncbi:XkdW family protein [Bacillus inaquosorum]|uniref:XkdW family protein n=1 Tax=Bacillus inaquosorum TaxID=483913 RepID=UPI0022831CAE|nr:XkdW family protein [Bacillus inaquosorum]MCY9008405.1 XkdW family protein [Bacillus inaquosorum]MCY9038531.1 XkdW family protein [Bacillus inaquosorum]MCY9043779.1 XkdW family protein [Bacillus inaquosorum]
MGINIGQAMLVLFPNATPNVDYVVMLDGDQQWIDENQWYLDAPIPSAAELEAAYKKYLEQPAPDSETSVEELQAGLTTTQQANSVLIKQLNEATEAVKKAKEDAETAHQIIAELIVLTTEKGVL